MARGNEIAWKILFSGSLLTFAATPVCAYEGPAQDTSGAAQRARVRIFAPVDEDLVLAALPGLEASKYSQRRVNQLALEALGPGVLLSPGLQEAARTGPPETRAYLSSLKREIGSQNTVSPIQFIRCIASQWTDTQNLPAVRETLVCLNEKFLGPQKQTLSLLRNQQERSVNLLVTGRSRGQKDKGVLTSNEKQIQGLAPVFEAALGECGLSVVRGADTVGEVGESGPRIKYVYGLEFFSKENHEGDSVSYSFDLSGCLSVHRKFSLQIDSCLSKTNLPVPNGSVPDGLMLPEDTVAKAEQSVLWRGDTETARIQYRLGTEKLEHSALGDTVYRRIVDWGFGGAAELSSWAMKQESLPSELGGLSLSSKQEDSWEK